MKNDSNPEVNIMDPSHKPRRPKSREVSSRFLSSTKTASLESILASPNQAISPVRHKPISPFTDTRSPKSQLDHSGSIRGLWPSSNKKLDTLADHLGNERLKDHLERKASLFDRNRSCRESSSFENEKEKDNNAKENHRPILGGSMRYTRKLMFPGKSSSSSTSSTSKFSNNSHIVPRRFSVDENVLYQKPSSRRTSDSFSDTHDSGSECSDACSGTTMESPNVGRSSTGSSRKSGIEVSSKYMNDIPARHRRGTSDSNIPNPASADNSPRLNKFTVKNVMKRANSLTGSKSATTQWALSPGRSGSPPMSVESKAKPMSFSSLKPPTSSSRAKGVEKLLNLGLDLFKSKKSSLVRSNSVSGHNITGTGHQLRLFHNRLMQWRYANARAHIANKNIAHQAQTNVLYAWDGLLKLRHSVLHKKLRLQKEKLDMKLNFVLHSQLKPLETWGDLERQHMAAISVMKECLHSAVCRVPLIEGAEVDTQSAAFALRHASDLTSSIKLMLSTFSPSAEQTVSSLSKLTEVVAQEKLLLEECLELFRTVSTLEIQERNLRCGIIQMELWKQQQIKQ